MRKIGKTASSVGLLLALIGPSPHSSAEEGTNDTTTAQTQRASKLNEALKQGASEMNNGLPIMVDSETRLDSTSGGNMSFRYNLTMVNLSPEDLDLEGFTNEMQPLLVNKVCTTKEMQVFIENGVPVTYSYYGKGGKHFASFTVEPDHCKSN
ncbi:hypothetical protein [Gilvimarinus algae]|uniref:Uncharacterized protein n=1 Tax=Gilvimarinus algae TaxID=3058037 RepID=A0ABT8TEC3_9GAMM|nr:hypothetical protein [Gilvimarinus sp. SDUM040014]MDO3382462.1 hypothetical protein [Gilvimarinus sp. SDUM040014]